MKVRDLLDILEWNSDDYFGIVRDQIKLWGSDRPEDCPEQYLGHEIKKVVVNSFDSWSVMKVYI